MRSSDARATLVCPPKVHSDVEVRIIPTPLLLSWYTIYEGVSNCQGRGQRAPRAGKRSFLQLGEGGVAAERAGGEWSLRRFTVFFECEDLSGSRKVWTMDRRSRPRAPRCKYPNASALPQYNISGGRWLAGPGILARLRGGLSRLGFVRLVSGDGMVRKAILGGPRYCTFR